MPSEDRTYWPAGFLDRVLLTSWRLRSRITLERSTRLPASSSVRTAVSARHRARFCSARLEACCPDFPPRIRWAPSLFEGLLPSILNACGTESRGLSGRDHMNLRPCYRDDSRKHAHEDSEADSEVEDRKSTRLNSSHVKISYAVFCLKKKKKK